VIIDGSLLIFLPFLCHRLCGEVRLCWKGRGMILAWHLKNNFNNFNLNFDF
jgi:hypothetical protein